MEDFWILILRDLMKMGGDNLYSFHMNMCDTVSH